MKNTICSALWLVFLFILASCEKETILSVDQSSVEISDAGGSATVSLTANKPWSASSNQSWCKVSPSAGEEATNSRITITCDPNTTYDARNCTVTFTCAELTKTVSISQATNNGLLVSQTEYNITNAAQQLEIKVLANVKFSVEVDNGCKDWVKYNTTKGLTTSTVILDIAKNESYDNREGKVTIKQDGGNLSSTVVIKQGQTYGLFLTTSEYNLSNEKHTLTVEVKSNIEFEVKSEANWIKYVETKGLKTNQIILDVETNETYDTREGKVTVKQKNGDLTGTITVRQDQNYGILVTQSEYNLTNEAQTIDIEVKYNVYFDVIIPEECQDWIEFVSTKSLDSRTYTFSIAKNETYDDREGSITFKQKDGTKSGTVIIKQDQTNGLFVTISEYELSNEEHTITVELKSNIDYEIKPEVDWITHVETKGLKTNQIILAIDKNDTYDAREGKVSVRQKNGNLTAFITVKQAEKNGLILSQTDFELDNYEHIIDVEVMTNVEYDIIIPDDCSTWISPIRTKGLGSQTCSFTISKNDNYDGREGNITFKQKDGPLSGTIVIRQSQTDGLIAEKTEFKLTANEQSLDIRIKSNVHYDVVIDDSCKDWLTLIQTKGLTENIVSLFVAKNEGDTRTGKVYLNGEGLREEITIVQDSGGGVEFDDPLFKALCVEYYDENGDEELSFEEAKSITTLPSIYKGTTSLKGIEHMPNLKYLNCSGSFYYHNGKITSLDLSNNTALEYLDCSNNKITKLDLSKNTALTYLECYDNFLTSLDLSNNTALTHLKCMGNPYGNQIESLDLTKNTALSELNCIGNQLTNLDISHNKALTVLWCSGNQLTSLDISNNPALVSLDCSHNLLSSLDVSHCSSLHTLWCQENRLTDLTLGNNASLVSLLCSSNQLVLIDFSGCSALEVLECWGNQLNSLDVDNNRSLIKISCSGNSLKCLDTKNNTVLETLECMDNQLSYLDLSNNIALKGLFCHKNCLNNLDVSHNTLLESLNCENNQLSSLDLSNNPALMYLWCAGNPQLKEIWLKPGHTLQQIERDLMTVIKYMVNGGAGTEGTEDIELEEW